MKRMILVMALMVVLLGGLASAQTARRGGTLRVGLDSDPPNMDPHQSVAAVDWWGSIFGGSAFRPTRS